MDPAIDTALRLALALLFLAAAWHKLRDPRGFRVALADYRLLPAATTSAVAALLVTAEVAAAVLLLVATPRAAGPLLGAALLALYAGAVAVNLLRGRRHIDCGCGAGGATLTWSLVARNAILLAAALACLTSPRARALGWVDALSVVGTVAALAALYGAAGWLQAIAPRAARLREGT